MMFLQVYPIPLYILFILSTIIIAFLFVMIKRKREKNLLLFLSNVNEEILKTVDGISANFEIAKIDEIELPLENYKSCICIIDTTKNLNDYIKKIKEISTNFENFHVVSLINQNRKLRGALNKKIIYIKKEELEKTIHSLLSKQY